ncbi:hypothetical protein [Phenylobacterium sp.]|jgi:hypothetical protein|uniref:hypothetical protein n=1 Tax=Phenylobacterium sp. TaxID=1871053 RepID=UPI0037C6DF68
MSARVAERLVAELDSFLADVVSADNAISSASSFLPQDVLEWSASVLTMKQGLSYRDGLFIQLAWGLEAPGADHTQKGEGGRSAASRFATALAERHVPVVKDAYQNIGKNNPNLARGNVPAFDRLLRWMNGARAEERVALLTFLLATVSKTARPVLPMPVLARADLTFINVVDFLEDLLSTPSGGAHEQFAVAAFLEALLDEFGVKDLWVKTKNINASDASAGTAADVQIVRGNKIEEAFEVSASDWRTKVTQALQTAKGADLQRVNVLAYGDDLVGLREALQGATADVSVMDVRSLLRLIAGILRKPAREVALRRLYELLERNQPDIERVNAMVRLLRRHSLTA